MASSAASVNLILFSVLPPHSSVLWLLMSDRNCSQRYPFAACNSTPSNPAAFAFAAATRY